MGNEPVTAAPVVTTASVAEAALALARGSRVLLVVDAAHAAAALDGLAAEPGRLSLFLGEPSDPEAQTTATEMARELGRL